MREIRIRSNAGGRDRARRLEFARIWEGEILRGFEFARMRVEDTAREYSSSLECGGERPCGRFEFARMREEVIAREYSNLLEY